MAIIREIIDENSVMLSTDNMNEKILYSEKTGGRLWSVIIQTVDEEIFNYQEVDLTDDERAFRQQFIDAENERLAQEARMAEFLQAQNNDVESEEENKENEVE